MGTLSGGDGTGSPVPLSIDRPWPTWSRANGQGIFAVRSLLLSPPMNTIADHAERVLRSHPCASMRLASLRRALADRVDHSLTDLRLRTILEEAPDRFRVLDAWDARWPECRQEAARAGRAWVVALDRPDGVSCTGARRLTESVRWVGRSLDGRARLDAGRWAEIAASEEPTRQALGPSV